MIDLIILIFVLFGALIGFKRGFTKELVKSLGFIVVVVLAFFLKNPLSVILYKYLPFFKFGILKNAEIFNILIYELLAFIIALIILGIILKVVLMASSIFEKILNATIILSIPSKILGAIVGIIHHYLLAFLILYILSIFCVDWDLFNESKYKDKILNETPIISNMVSKSVDVIDEFVELKDKYQDKNISENEFNYMASELFLKYDVISVESLNELFDNGKITKFNGYEELLSKYEGEQNGNKK